MKLILPLNVQISKKKKWYINLNAYRNGHFQVLNKAKILFKEEIADQVKKLPEMERIGIIYTVYPKTLRDFDVANVCSIADKFFCDALVEMGRIPDDNVRFIPEVGYRFGAHDKANPRIEAKIHDLS